VSGAVERSQTPTPAYRALYINSVLRFTHRLIYRMKTATCGIWFVSRMHRTRSHQHKFVPFVGFVTPPSSVASNFVSCGRRHSYSLWVRRSADRIPVWGWARFSAPVQTEPGAHPASCTVGTGSLSRTYSGGGVAVTTHTHLVKGKGKGFP
jgi:hypothetical protein